MSAAAIEIPGTIDDLYPRTVEERYRIYAVNDEEMTILVTAPTAAGVGLALIQLHEDQREIGRALSDLGRIGVLDTMPGGKPAPKGDWIILPWDRRFA